MLSIISISSMLMSEPEATRHLWPPKQWKCAQIQSSFVCVCVCARVCVCVCVCLCVRRLCFDFVSILISKAKIHTHTPVHTHTHSHTHCTQCQTDTDSTRVQTHIEILEHTHLRIEMHFTHGFSIRTHGSYDFVIAPFSSGATQTAAIACMDYDKNSHLRRRS